VNHKYAYRRSHTDHVASVTVLFYFLAVLDPRVGHTFLHLYLSSVILIDSSTGSPVQS